MNSPPTPEQPRFVGSSADDAWEIAERVLNGKKLTPRVLYGDEGKMVEDSDTDFEADAVRHRVASERPSLKRKYAASGLRDDRGSMTKRSASRKVRNRTPLKIATQRSIAVNDSNGSDGGAPCGGRREVIDEHEVVLLDGEKSEMSGTDNEDADVSKCPEPLSRSGMRRRISLATSTISPVSKLKTDSEDKALRFETPAEFSRHENGFNIRCENAVSAEREGVLEARGDAGFKSCSLNDQKSTPRRARDLVSMFNSDSEDSSQRSPPSARGRLKRLRVSVPDSFRSEDSDCEQANARLEEKGEYLAAPTTRLQVDLGSQTRTPRRKIVFESESDDGLSEPAASEKFRGKAACLDECNAPNPLVGSTTVCIPTLQPVVSSESHPHKSTANPQSAKKANPDEDKDETDCLVNHSSQGNEKRHSVVSREGHSFSLDERNRDFISEEMLHCDSPSQSAERDVVDIRSSSEEGDRDAERRRADALSEEESDDGPGRHRVMTRSVARRASQIQRPTSHLSASDSGSVSNDSSKSSGDSSLEILSDVQVADQKPGREDECTPTKQRRWRSCFLRSGDRKYSITPESTPSPPSTRRRSRLCKLATKYSDDDDQAKDTSQGESCVRASQVELVASPSQLPDPEKTGKCFREQKNLELSQSDADSQTPSSAEKRRTAVKSLCKRREIPSANVPPVRRAIFQDYPREPNDDVRKSEAQGRTQARGSEQSIRTDVVVDVQRGKGQMDKDAVEDVIDLVNDEESRHPTDTLDEAPESDSPVQADEIWNSSSARNSSLGEEDNAKDVITIEDDKPPPFNLLILCNPGESVKQMAERLGEEEIMDRVTEAQCEGREIVGGEELGLGESFNTGVFNQFSETVVAEQIGRERKVNNVTEQALRGEYKFNYRGRDMGNQPWRSGRGGKKWYRGQHRGGRGGRSGGDGRGRGGRLANLRRRRG